MTALAGERLTFTSFGVAIEVRVPARLVDAALEVAPPAYGPPQSTDAPLVSVGVAERDGELEVYCDDRSVGAFADEQFAMGVLDAQIRAQIALLAPSHIFVHAGVVAVDDQAVVLPGFTHAGKTTLTRALVQAGAVYYSDEFAVFDAEGLVHPYAKPLSIRHHDGSGRTKETPAAALGGSTGSKPIPLGLVAVTSYQAGARLGPEPMAPGQALLALLGHTIPARDRPQQALSTLKVAVADARAWKSVRGEAKEAARTIIAMLA